MAGVELEELTARWRWHHEKWGTILRVYRPKVHWKPENLVALKAFLTRKVGKKRMKRWITGPPDTGV